MSGSSACGSPLTWSVPLSGRDVEQLLAVAERPLVRPAGPEPDHPLFEPLAAAGRVDGDADRGVSPSLRCASSALSLIT